MTDVALKNCYGGNEDLFFQGQYSFVSYQDVEARKNAIKNNAPTTKPTIKIPQIPGSARKMKAVRRITNFDFPLQLMFLAEGEVRLRLPQGSRQVSDFCKFCLLGMLTTLPNYLSNGDIFIEEMIYNFNTTEFEFGISVATNYNSLGLLLSVTKYFTNELLQDD